MPYNIKLVRTTEQVQTVYPTNFFPRKIVYKDEAQRIADRVQKLGGEVKITPVVTPRRYPNAAKA